MVGYSGTRGRSEVMVRSMPPLPLRRADMITSARSATCSALSGRPSGAFASIAITRSLTGRGTSDGSGGTGSCLCMIAIASGCSATNGGSPARHS